jgi:hypothetical protein
VKLYTFDELLTLIGSISCEADLIELDYYIASHARDYTLDDLELFGESIETLYKIFEPKQKKGRL